MPLHRELKRIGLLKYREFLLKGGASLESPLWPEVEAEGAQKGMAAQRTAENAGADAQINIFLPASVDQGKAAGITDIDVLEATDYYRNRCPAEGSGTRMLVSHAASAIAWDVFAVAQTIRANFPRLDLSSDSQVIPLRGERRRVQSA